MNKVTPYPVTTAGRVRAPPAVTCRTTEQEQVGQCLAASSSRPFLASWFDEGNAETDLESKDTKGEVPLLPPKKSRQVRWQHSLLYCILAFQDAMELSRCLGTLQLLPIQHLLLQLLKRLKQPNK